MTTPEITHISQLDHEDHDAVVQMAQREHALQLIESHIQEGSTQDITSQIASIDRYDSLDDFQDFMEVFDEGEDPAVPVRFVGPAELLKEDSLRRSFYKKAGAVVLVIVCEDKDNARVSMAVEQHIVGDN